MKLKHLLSIIFFNCVVFGYTNSLVGSEPETIVPDFQVNQLVETDFSMLFPVAGVAGNGDFVIAWQDVRTGQKNIYAQRFNKDGTPLGDNFLVNDDSKKNNKTHFPPAIAVDKNGDFIIVWADNRISVTAPYRLRFQMYEKDGNAIGDNKSVDEDVLSGFDQSSPAVAFADSGHVIVVWEECLSGGYKDIAMRKLDNQGNYLGNIVMINDDNIDLRRQHASIACNSDGNYIIAWQDYSLDFNGGDVFYKRFDTNDSQIGIELYANDEPRDTLSAQRDVVVAINDAGDFIMSWKDNRNGNYDIFAQRFNTEGEILGPNFRVDTDPESLDQQNPGVGIKEDGSCLLIWTDLRNGGEIYGQLLDEAGAFDGANFIINDDTTRAQMYSDIGIDENNDFIITWQDNRNSPSHSDVFIQKILSDGTLYESNFMIIDDTWNFIQTKSQISSFSNGNRIVTWWEPRAGIANIYAQIYDKEANPIGENIKVNGNNYSSMPNVAAGSDNRALVVWSNYKKLKIQGQMVSGDGTLSGSIIKIDTLDNGAGNVSVDFNNGTYIVTWRAVQQPDYGNIFARRFDENGLSLGPSFKVNDDLGTTMQEKPDIAIDDQVGFLIVWQDLREFYYKVFGQFYNSDGEKINNNFKLYHNESDSLFNISLPRVVATDNNQFAVVYRTHLYNIESNVNLCFLDDDGTNSTGIILTDEPINDLPGKVNDCNPSITTNDNSQIVVSWEDVDENNNFIIHGQRLKSNTKIGSNFTISSVAGSDQYYSAVSLWEKDIFIIWEDNRQEIPSFDIWGKVLNFGNTDGTSISNQIQNPKNFTLSQNYPNPFNPATTIKYQIAKKSHVELKIFNIHGKVVKKLVDQTNEPGIYEIDWNASKMSSGVYFYKIIADNFVEVKKCILMK